MFGHVTALEGLHVIRKIEETKAQWRYGRGTPVDGTGRVFVHM